MASSFTCPLLRCDLDECLLDCRGAAGEELELAIAR